MQSMIAAVYSVALHVMGTALCLIGIAVLAALALDYHRRLVRESAERECRRISAYLRKQANTAEIVSKCKFLSERSRDQEGYSSAVLEELAFEIDAKAHYADVKS